MIKNEGKSRAPLILGLMVVVLALFIVSEFIGMSFDNRSKAAESVIEGQGY